MSENNFCLSQKLAVALQKHRLKLALVESRTGGVVKRTNHGTEWQFKLVRSWGWITYSNAAKIDLGVNPQTLECFGAVSAETATEMAKCAIKQSIADVSLSITGIAGPSGGTPAKPVGMVYSA